MDYAITVTTKALPKALIARTPLEDVPSLMREHLENAREELLSLIDKAILPRPYATKKQAPHKMTWKWSLITELFQSGLPHFHGIVKIYNRLPTKSVVTYLNLSFNSLTLNSKRLGHVLIKSQYDWSGWSSYCYKKIQETKEMTNIWPVVIDEISMFPNYWDIIESEDSDVRPA